jgi:DNA-binding transcriptional ArsR family regulator
MPNLSIQLNRVFYALADPTRRYVLERLCDGPAPVSELAQPIDMALSSFTQHLDVLEDCGLVRSRKSGRVRTYQLVPRPLKSAERWIVEQRAIWESRLDQLDSYLKTIKEKKP